MNGLLITQCAKTERLRLDVNEFLVGSLPTELGQLSKLRKWPISQSGTVLRFLTHTQFRAFVIMMLYVVLAVVPQEIWVSMACTVWLHHCLPNWAS